MIWYTRMKFQTRKQEYPQQQQKTVMKIIIIWISKIEKKEFKWAASNSCNGEKEIEAISQITYEANIVRWTVNWQVRRKSHKPNTNGDITVYNKEREGNQKPNTRSAFTRKESNVLSTSPLPSSSSSSTWCIPRIRWMLTAKHLTFNAWTSALFEFYRKH